jgi:poly(3-hydroxybutyrate) depolymerase
MYTKWLPKLAFGLALGLIGCASSTLDPSGAGGTQGGTHGSTAGTGGTATAGTTGDSSKGGSSTGGTSTGGTSLGEGGTSTGGTSTGGTSTGGTSTGGTSTGGTAAGGHASGEAGTGGHGGAAGASTGGSSGTTGGGGATSTTGVRMSKGCGVMNGAKTITTGGMSVSKGLATSTALKITSAGMNREFIIDIPANYDATKPYRLVFSWHQAYGSDVGNANGQYPANNGPNFDAAHYAFFGLKRAASEAGQADTAIFVAPEGIGNLPWDYKRDVTLFDDLLTLVDANLCIDDNRVFSTGFSFGAMMSYALSITRQTKLRAVVAMAAANYNLPNEPTDSNAGPIAYMGTTGMSDGTCPWGTDTMGGKACNLQHAKDNNCTIPAGNNIPTTTAGSKKYVCYDFAGCKEGYPVKTCTFDGNHTPSAVDDGTSSGDDGEKSFIPPLAWKFMAQF